MIQRYSQLRKAEEEEDDSQEDPNLVSPYISGWITPKGEIINGKEWGYDEHIAMLEDWGFDFPEEEEDQEYSEYVQSVIELAISKGWIRFAGSYTERNWIPKGNKSTVNFQICTESLPLLKEVLRYKLDPRTKEIIVDNGNKYFQGTPEDFLKRGFNDY